MFPGFSADVGLEKKEGYQGIANNHQKNEIVPASWWSDLLCKTLGIDCPPPKNGVTCTPINTTTRCFGVVLWCYDHYRCSDGSSRTNGYPCGICFGLPF